MTMLRTFLISLALTAAAIALGMGGVEGMQDGGLRASDGVLLLSDTISMTSASGDSASDGDLLGMQDGGLMGMQDGGLMGMQDGGLLGVQDGGLQEPSAGALDGMQDGGL